MVRYSEGGLWARFKYVCCKEAGAPVAMVSRGPDHARVNRLEGTYCPEKVGSSGRLDYIQKAWGGWQTKKLAKLTFSEVTGKWCIGSTGLGQMQVIVRARVTAWSRWASWIYVAT
ncbi:unnamed protein product [Symbiodinium microadriaticum]|nr:unnamed protein product [Symbiodinium microadriaticum]